MFSARYRELFTFYFAQTPVFDYKFDIIVFPVSLLSVFREQSQKQSFPVPFIAYGDAGFLSAAFDAGAADFLKDPWKMEELGSRILNYIKNSRTVINKNTLCIDPAKLTIMDKSCRISHKEYMLLRLLSLHYGNLVHKQTIQNQIWNKILPDRSKALEMLITRLRKKIREAGIKQEIIKTVKPFGYIISDET